MCEPCGVVIVDKDSVDVADPHGYFCDTRRPVLNFKSPTKRSFLNECIRQIYILNGDAMPNIPNTAIYNHYHMWSNLNELMAPQKVSHHQQKVERVKRRLFCDTKLRLRKNKNVFRNVITETECFYYKPQRSQLGIKKIRRKYLDIVSNGIDAERRQNLKRKQIDESCYAEKAKGNTYSVSHFNALSDGLQISQQMINKVYRYHGNMARSYPQRERSMEERIKRERNTEACRLNRRARKLEELLVQQQYQERLLSNEKVLEASIRSILYMKALMGIMVSGCLPDESNFYA